MPQCWVAERASRRQQSHIHSEIAHLLLAAVPASIGTSVAAWDLRLAQMTITDYIDAIRYFSNTLLGGTTAYSIGGPKVTQIDYY